MSMSCERCLLSDAVPGVEVGTEGVCSVCRQHDETWGNWEERKGERLSALQRMFEDCRRKKRPYDVLVPLSGGKDSTYVLYLCRRQFGLNCLAVTWDNGFLTTHARENIERATSALGVDHIYYRVNEALLMRLYRHFFVKTGMFCPVCMRGIGVTTEMAARAFNVPLVVNGTSRRTEEHIAPEFFQSGELSFFRAVLTGDPLERAGKPLMYSRDWKRAVAYHIFWWTHIERVFHSAAICLPDYVDWYYDEIFRTITGELGWSAPHPDAEHADCKVDGIVAYMRQKKFPALPPGLLRYSKLVTAGQMTREEALGTVSELGCELTEPKNLAWFLNTLGISRAEFDQVLSDPLRHMQYRREPGRVWRFCRATKRVFLNPLLGVCGGVRRRAPAKPLPRSARPAEPTQRGWEGK